MTEPMPCPRHPHRLTAPGLVVCSGCLDRLLEDLAYVRDNWHHLRASIAIGTRGHGTGHTIPGSRPPLPIDLVDHARDWHQVLLAWCRLVCEDRRVDLMPITPEEQSDWLTTHAPWLCEQDFGDEACDEVHDLACRLGAAIGDSDKAWTVPCPAPATERARTGLGATEGQNWTTDAPQPPEGPQSATSCGFRLRVIRPPLPVDGRPAERLTVYCRACGRLWDAGSLLEVARAQGRAVWVDGETAALQLGTNAKGLANMVRAGNIVKRHNRYQIGVNA